MPDRSLFFQADKEWDEGHLKKAFQLFELSAKQGDSSSMISLGYFFDNGIAVRKNTKKAMLWYKKAARKGEVIAFTNIGTVYRDVGNFERARFWFLKAYKSGDGDAALELAKLYLSSKKKSRIVHAKKYLRLTLKSKCVTEASIEEANGMLKKLAKAT